MPTQFGPGRGATPAPNSPPRVFSPAGDRRVPQALPAQQLVRVPLICVGLYSGRLAIMMIRLCLIFNPVIMGSVL